MRRTFMHLRSPGIPRDTRPSPHLGFHLLTRVGEPALFIQIMELPVDRASGRRP